MEIINSLDLQVLKNNIYLSQIKNQRNKEFIEKLKRLNLGSKNREDLEKKQRKLKELSIEFESIFVHQMIKTMRATVGKSHLYHGGMAEDIYQEMLDKEYAKSMAENKDFGIAEIVYNQLSRYLK
jgi:flagellar protein FlgJ